MMEYIYEKGSGICNEGFAIRYSDGSFIVTIYNSDLHGWMQVMRTETPKGYNESFPPSDKKPAKIGFVPNLRHKFWQKLLELTPEQIDEVFSWSDNNA